MSRRGELLVAIINDARDMSLAQHEHWYRIPVESAEKFLKGTWPPQWLALYQTKVFGTDAHAVNYYAPVIDIRQAFRFQLIPEQPDDERGRRIYYQLMLGPLERLPRPIYSRRRRRLVFIPTTWDKFIQAAELNDLYDESPLEDRLWAELKRLQLSAERQEYVQVGKDFFALDFAIYCAAGKLDVETDGDRWHSDPRRIPQDNFRDNALETTDWSLLRFNTKQINEQMVAYCLPTIAKEVNNLRGVDEGGIIPRKVDLKMPRGARQATLFDGRNEESGNDNPTTF